MAETTLQLGFVPKERGSYASGTNYYKDNVVQYNGSSYIADPVGWSESDPTATYVTVPPTDASGNLNAGWKVFASGNNTFTTGEKVDNVGIDVEPTVGSNNLIKSGGVAELGYSIENHEYLKAITDNEGKLLEGIKTDGIKEINLPTTFKENVNIEGIITNKNLTDSVNAKVDKEQDKSLIDEEYASSQSTIESSEYIQSITDSEEKILEGIKADGTKVINLSVETPSVVIEHEETTEWISTTTDAEGKVLRGRKTDGTLVENVGIEAKSIIGQSATIETLNLNTQLNLSEEAKDKLKDDLSLGDNLPNYYFEDDYITNKVKEINNFWLNTGANADLFLFFTDAHYYANFLKTVPLMEYVLKNTCIRKVIYGGDTAHNTGYDTVEDVTWENRVAKTIIPYSKYFPVRGNHDYYNNNKLFPYTAVRNNLLNLCNVESIVISESEISVYYYYDDDISKIRYIILDTFDPYNPNYVNRLEISDEQFAFVANALNTVPNGYSVIMIGHTSPQNGMMQEDIEYNRAENLRKFLAAYQNRGSVTINGNTYDFTSATSNILMYVAGHSHEDMQNYVDGTLYVSVPCDSYNRNKTASMHTYHEYPQVAGNTINEQCFDACVFDRSNNIVNFVRIGWGFNRRFNLNRIDLQIGNTQQLSSVFETISQWLIHDSQGATYDTTLPRTSEWWSFTNNVATIDANGIATALSAGECYAIAIADNGDKEFFYIRVQ